MKHVKLGSSDLQVSEVCLGTMTWGNQNTQDEAFEQIDFALEKGINFMDTAEMYSVPPSKETYGLTEKLIGNWLAKNKSKRNDIILASKIAGPSIPWVRGGSNISGETIQQAVDASLIRLQTDYLDLYQLHWTNRPSPHFSRHWPGQIKLNEIDAQQQQDEHLEILTSLSNSVKAGKIRHVGLSNDTPWGINQYLRLAETNDLPKIVSLQNEFSLIHLNDSPHIIETCVLNDIAYLPWSPLGGGALSGKYMNGATPEGCRWSIQQRNGIFRDTTQTHAAIDRYHAIAKKHGLSLAQMSLAWVYQFHAVTSTIIGATSMQQLKENLDAYKLELGDEILKDIRAAIKLFPVPF